MLKFSRGNAKLDKSIYTFSLPSGYSCPFADSCLSKADKITGKISDGPHTDYRCFSASQESLYPNVRFQRWHNYNELRGLNKQGMYGALIDSLPADAAFVRIHAAGDFFNQDYFDAWLDVAATFPLVRFYFYTKSLRYWVRRIEIVGTGHKPGQLNNFVPTASYGGRDDHMIAEYGLRFARVIGKMGEASRSRMTIDHDDSCAMNYGKSFCLLLHGIQPKGGKRAAELSKLKKNGWNGYSRKSLQMATV